MPHRKWTIYGQYHAVQDWSKHSERQKLHLVSLLLKVPCDARYGHCLFRWGHEPTGCQRLCSGFLPADGINSLKYPPRKISENESSQCMRHFCGKKRWDLCVCLAQRRSMPVAKSQRCSSSSGRSGFGIEAIQCVPLLRSKMRVECGVAKLTWGCDGCACNRCNPQQHIAWFIRCSSIVREMLLPMKVEASQCYFLCP